MGIPTYNELKKSRAVAKYLRTTQQLIALILKELSEADTVEEHNSIVKIIGKTAGNMTKAERLLLSREES
jgi:hypothetical protein